MNAPFDLSGKVAIVTGGASGIGAETARLVISEGGKAVIADRDEARGRALATELGASAHFVALDVAEESTQYARYNILVQSGTAMLAQANQMPQNLLRLMQ